MFFFQLANADGRANVSGLSGGLENPQADVDFFFHTEGLLGAPWIAPEFWRIQLRILLNLRGLA